MGRAERSGTAASVRPEAWPRTTERDIHISQAGQARPPEGPDAATRISVWRPIPEQTTIRPEPALTEDQLAMQAQLKEYVEEELLLPESDPYAKWEKVFLSRSDTYPRYLRASKFNLQDAKNRIKGTLEWRRSYKPDLIPPTEIAKEAEGGKVVVNGFDIHGRPIVWLRPSRENTKPSPTQVRHLIWQLERAIDIMPPGVNKLALVVDYKGANNSNNPPLSTAKEVINILQNHYCERLGRAVVINVPWYLNSFFSLLKPFLDPATKDKIKFNPAMQDLVTSEQLDAEFGGEHAYFYDHRVYMPALCHYCGIRDDGTRDPKPLKDQPEARPDELQRKLTSQVDESDRLAEEARQELERQEKEQAPAAAETPAATAEAEAAPAPSASSEDSSMAVPAVAGAAAVAGGSAIAAAAHKTPTEQGEAEVMRVLAAQNSSSSAASASTAPPGSPLQPGAEPALAEPTPSLAAPAETAGAAKPAAPSPAIEEEPAAPVASTSAVPAPAGPSEKAPAAAPGQPAKQEGRSSIQERSIPTPTPSQPAQQPASKPKGFKKLLAMCGCGPSGAKQAFENGDSKPVVAEKAPAMPAVPSADSEATAASLPAEPGRDRVKIAPEAAASKSTTAVPLATNATFGPEAYQTALEGPESADDYFAQGDLRKAQALPHDATEKDAAQAVTQPERIMQRLHTGGSGELVLAFEVKEPPKELAAEGGTAEVEANGASKIAEQPGSV